MNFRRFDRCSLAGKVIDAHSHVGVCLRTYCRNEYPYAQSAESLYYRQLAGGVDLNIAFPYSSDLYFEPACWLTGSHEPAARPLSPVPYAVENNMLLQEICEWRPDLRERFLPFVCVDPGRDVRGQLRLISEIEARYPVYGIKIAPVACATPVALLAGAGRDVLDYASERNLPLLFHAVPAGMDDYSQAETIMDIADERRDLRFCLAHALQFRIELLSRADAMPNVWVDTSALKIQVDLNRLLFERGEVRRSDLLPSLWDDHCAVMVDLCTRYPRTMIWGTDAPAYAYICRRRDNADFEREFRLFGRYEDELAALNALDASSRARACNVNTLDFLFGAAIANKHPGGGAL